MNLRLGPRRGERGEDVLVRISSAVTSCKGKEIVKRLVWKRLNQQGRSQKAGSEDGWRWGLLSLRGFFAPQAATSTSQPQGNGQLTRHLHRLRDLAPLRRVIARQVDHNV